MQENWQLHSTLLGITCKYFTRPELESEVLIHQGLSLSYSSNLFKFEKNSPSDWLNQMVQTLRGCVTFEL